MPRAAEFQAAKIHASEPAADWTGGSNQLEVIGMLALVRGQSDTAQG